MGNTLTADRKPLPLDRVKEAAGGGGPHPQGARRPGDAPDSNVKAWRFSGKYTVQPHAVDFAGARHGLNLDEWSTYLVVLLQAKGATRSKADADGAPAVLATQALSELFTPRGLQYPFSIQSSGELDKSVYILYGHHASVLAKAKALKNGLELEKLLASAPQAGENLLRCGSPVPVPGGLFPKVASGNGRRRGSGASSHEATPHIVRAVGNGAGPGYHLLIPSAAAARDVAAGSDVQSSSSTASSPSTHHAEPPAQLQQQQQRQGSSGNSGGAKPAFAAPPVLQLKGFRAAAAPGAHKRGSGGDSRRASGDSTPSPGESPRGRPAAAAATRPAFSLNLNTAVRSAATESPRGSGGGGVSAKLAADVPRGTLSFTSLGLSKIPPRSGATDSPRGRGAQSDSPRQQPAAPGGARFASLNLGGVAARGGGGAESPRDRDTPVKPAGEVSFTSLKLSTVAARPLDSPRSGRAPGGGSATPRGAQAPAAARQPDRAHTFVDPPSVASPEGSESASAPKPARPGGPFARGDEDSHMKSDASTTDDTSSAITEDIDDVTAPYDARMHICVSRADDDEDGWKPDLSVEPPLTRRRVEPPEGYDDDLDEKRLHEEREQKMKDASAVCSKVLPYLMVSGQTPVESLETLVEAKVTHIVNTAEMIIPCKYPDFVHYTPVRMRDAPSENIMNFFPHAVRTIEAARRTKGGNCLVHCHQGVSRSVTVVAAYLMWKQGLAPEAAITAVRDARDVARPNAGFALKLQKWHEHLHNAPRVSVYRLAPFSDEHPTPPVLALEAFSPDHAALDPRTAYVVTDWPSRKVFLWAGAMCPPPVTAVAQYLAPDATQYAMRTSKDCPDRLEWPASADSPVVVPQGSEPDDLVAALASVGCDAKKPRMLQSYNGALDRSILSKWPSWLESRVASFTEEAERDRRTERQGAASSTKLQMEQLDIKGVWLLEDADAEFEYLPAYALQGLDEDDFMDFQAENEAAVAVFIKLRGDLRRADIWLGELSLDDAETPARKAEEALT
eukprot:gene4760-7318_t